MGAEQADYRVELYPPYHAHRDPMPAELRSSGRRRPALLESLGWTVATSDELEADDVMFSLARAEEERGGRALLLTGDRDLFGAVSERVAVLELRKGGAHARDRARRGARALRRRAPSRCPTSSPCAATPPTGCPGAPGIGAKTAAELLREHGSLEAVLRAAGATRARRLAPRPSGRSRCARGRRRAARERGAAAHVQADRDAAADRGRAPAGPRDRLRRRRAAWRGELGHAAPGRAPEQLAASGTRGAGSRA